MWNASPEKPIKQQNSAGGTQLLERTFDILETLAQEGPISLGSIAAQTGLSKSTVCRILGALCQRGYVEQEAPGEPYRLGLRMVELASIKLNQIELKTEAQPLLRELSAKVLHPVHLARQSGNEVVYIDKVEAVNSIRMYSAIGRRAPIYSTAMGKVLLSGKAPDEARRIAMGIVYEKKCENTVASPEQLLAQANAVKINGYAIDDEENEYGICCVAAPIFDYRGKIIAALSVSGSKRAGFQDDIEDIKGLVTETGLKISRRLGYNGDHR